VSSRGTGGPWSDPQTWAGGTVPAAGSRVAIAGPVVLDVDAAVGGLDIARGASLTFAPASSLVLRSTANIVNAGLLVMRPTLPSVVHRIEFAGIDEAKFVGGGMSVLATDVGLWVMDDGRLDLFGSPRSPWLCATSALAPGQRTLQVDGNPSGWQVGDEIVVTPTAKVDVEAETGFQHDLMTIAAVDGRTITFTNGLRFGHPTTAVGPLGTATAEVLNLTRNVRIEGSPTGHAHVFIHSQRPQSVKFAALRHLGPRHHNPERDDPRAKTDVLGRYGLHFHHCGDGSRGSQVEGVVARDLGSHAFVPHTSNGTTWKDCIAHETLDFAYWWDPENLTTDTVLERCVASAVGVNVGFYVNAGFSLGLGPDRTNVVRKCVASGTDGDGFLWYEGGVWQFHDNVAHNNGGSGIRVWQNDSQAQTVSQFLCYRNGGSGIKQGAYANSFHYEDGVLVDNAESAIGAKAVSVVGDDQGSLSFTRIYCDAGGAAHAVELPDGSPVEARRATIIEDCQFHNASKSAIGWYIHGDGDVGMGPKAAISGCTFDGNELWLPSGLGPDTSISYSDAARRVMVRPVGASGAPMPRWNAVTQPI
jgi:hypothetical protein